MRVSPHSCFPQTLAVAAALVVALGMACASTAQVPDSSEKASRTPAQLKIDSRLLYEIYRAEGLAAAKGVPPGSTGVRIDDKRRAYVDVRAEVTPELATLIATLGGAVSSTWPRDHSTLAWIPLLKIERLAEEPSVAAIQPTAEAIVR